MHSRHSSTCQGDSAAAVFAVKNAYAFGLVGEGGGVGLVIRLVNYAAMHLCLTTTVAVAAASHM